MNRALIDAALRVAERDRVLVFPCNARKVPLAGTNGFKDASADPDVVREMFGRRDAALIGMATGGSDLVVIDIDRKNGRDGTIWLRANLHRLPATRVHTTPSAGLHLVYRAAGASVSSNASKIAPGIDTRGRGGYVCWPSGVPGLDDYSVARDMPFALLQAWFAEACRPPPASPQPIRPIKVDGVGSPYGRGALRSALSAVRNAGNGEQADTLHREAFCLGSLVAGGEIPEAETLAALISAGRDMVSHDPRRPWTPAVVEKRVRGAFTAGQSNPRVAPPPEQRINRGGRANA